ncbi:MAG: DUF3048 domain-containing protein [Chloroflexi bacterium]|nr:DUF3048 domain-containing protein [Chloroflexota bacterium]
MSINRGISNLILIVSVLIVLTSCGVSTSLPLPSPVAPTTAPPTPNPDQRATRIAAGFTPTLPPTQTPFPLASFTPTPGASHLISAGLDPLSGEPLPKDSVLQRPLLVKLANWPEESRPPAGINQADMVFEYYIGYQQNHLLALFSSSDTPRVAPLAPARLPDLVLADLYQANLAVASAKPSVEDAFQYTLPDRVAMRGFAPCPGICNEFPAKGEQTVVDTQALRQYLKNQQTQHFIPELAVNVFNAEPSENSEPAHLLSVQYADFSLMEWHFDHATAKYQLWQDHEKPDGKYEVIPSSDDSDQPVAFDNLIVVYCKYIEHDSQTYDLDLRVVGKPGQALFFRDGRVTFGRWQVPSLSQPIQFRQLDGSLYPLKPGSTWLVFIAEKSKSDQPNPGEWQIAFSLK